MIAFDAETLRAGRTTVLRDVRFRAEAGEVVALCGPNGAGKTTLLRALAGLPPNGPPTDPRRVAYVPQGARSAWGLTVREIVALGRVPHRDAATAPVDAALAACGIAHLAARRIDRVSGGEARRAMLARALATEPDTLLLDEPTSDLDPAAAHAIMALLRDLAGHGKCVVVVLHAIELALRYAHRVAVVAGGRIAYDGPATDALAPAAAAFGLRFGIDDTPRLLAPD